MIKCPDKIFKPVNLLNLLNALKSFSRQNATFVWEGLERDADFGSDFRTIFHALNQSINHSEIVNATETDRTKQNVSVIFDAANKKNIHINATKGDNIFNLTEKKKLKTKCIISLIVIVNCFFRWEFVSNIILSCQSRSC